MQSRSASSSHGIVLWLGLSLVAVWVAGILLLMESSTYDIWGALFIGPALFAISIPLLLKEARRQNDPTLARLFVLALALKFIGGLARYYVAFGLYGGVADAQGYHGKGVHFALGFWDGTGYELKSMTGTGFIELITGLLYIAIRPTKLGGFMFFTWLSFWGLFLFYKAFLIAVPEGRSRTYAHWALLFPSLLFWPSSIGKEAWMIFTLGVVAYGGARMLSRLSGGILLTAAGLAGAAMVRPHVAAMIALGIAGAYLIKRPAPELRQLAPVVKLASLALIAAGAAVLIGMTQRSLKASDLYSLDGVQAALETTSQRADSGGSEFEPIIVTSPTDVPLAVATVLFRPTLFEVHNAQAAASAIEATFLLLVTLVRLPWILNAIKSVRRQPYVALAILYAAVFIFAFASFPNFGLLTRERSQLFPLFFVLLSIPPLVGARETENARP